MKEQEPTSLVLVVDDDRTLGRLIEAWLGRAGYRVEVCPDGESGLAALGHHLPDAVCLDLELPGLSGLETLDRIRRRHPDLPVLILTADSRVETIVEAMRRGAYDYLAKPIQREELANRLRHAVDAFRLALRVTRLERESAGGGYPGIVGSGVAMRSLFAEMDRLTRSEIAVLIHGESGVGKELIARALHDQGARRGGPFVAVNCAAIPETLQESELFGHEKGSFTGAISKRRGRFEAADGGTLFLDEVAELSPPAQAKLLRVLQERTFVPVGGSREQSSDFRLLAATHRDLRARVNDGRFREDLFFRIAVYELEVPPLRERLEDLPALCAHLLGQQRGRTADPPPTIDPRALRALERYPWPGNIRELENALERAVVVADGAQIELDHLAPSLRLSVEPESSGATSEPREPPSARRPVAIALEDEAGRAKTLAEIERESIERALERHDRNLSQVGRELGIGRTTLYRKLEKYRLR